MATKHDKKWASLFSQQHSLCLNHPGQKWFDSIVSNVQYSDGQSTDREKVDFFYDVEESTYTYNYFQLSDTILSTIISINGEIRKKTHQNYEFSVPRHDFV